MSFTKASHPQMQQNWTQPEIPELYDAIALSEYGFSRDLDFYNVAADVFFSQESGYLPGIEWPWADGFNPSPADWKEIGIQHIDFRNVFQ